MPPESTARQSPELTDQSPSEGAVQGSSVTSSPSSEPAPSASPSKRRWPSFLKVVRRAHLYMGLFMMPWVLLFGVTAFSFNHPGTFRDLEGRLLPAKQFHELSGFEPWDAGALAEQVAAQMSASGTPYEVVPDSAAFRGWAFFARPSDDGLHVVIVGLDRGIGFLSTRPAAPESEPPPFRGQSVVLEKFNTTVLAEQLAPVHQKLGITAEAPLRPHPKIHPELRFVARDASGQSWNVVHDLSSGALDGRKSDEARHGPAIELFESLHKQHHFPPSFGPTTVWALFGDLMALTLVFWAFSGLLMWWQMKKLRLVGASVVVFAAVVGTVVISTTADDLTFGAERPVEKE